MNSIEVSHKKLLEKYSDTQTGYYYLIRALIKKYPNGIECKCKFCENDKAKRIQKK
jgi:hypothetical protein